MARTRGGKSYRGERSFQLRDEDPENLENEEGTGGGTDDEEPKKTRGPTYMRHIWGRHGTDKRIKVKFNTLGELVGTNRSKFNEFLGALARIGKYAPIDIDSWRKIPKSLKNDMIDVVKEKFDLPVGIEERVKQSVGKKWRNWKHALKKTYFSPNESIESQVLKRPKRVLPQQWRNILTKWLSEESKRISATNKMHREKEKMNHSTGKKPFAQVRVEKEKEVGHPLSRADMFTICYTNSNGVPSSYEVGKKMEEMEGLKNQLPEGEEDSVGRNDVFARVMGEERSGRVRTYGLGVTQSDLWGDIPSRSTCFRLVMEQSAAMSKMERRIQQLESIQQGRSQGQSSPSQQRYTSQSSNAILRPIKVGDKVTVRSMVDSSKICAVGVVRNLDPTSEVGDTPLGLHWCEIHVNVPVENDEELMRPYHNFRKIGDAIGVAIAWPINLVILEEN
ncbi:uncharacterized protein [Coffea arabica]|uniref:Uncharacterized protein isoform X2 n=1 Tax=Coffea arabica TaxID=13443 RepID=A0A6P6WS88_COFAR|nr:uncharacterized protein LOC113735470 [Coffea arabica]